MTDSDSPVISISDLTVHYRARRGLFRAGKPVQAVNGISLDISKGETLGLVGESGCGKSTLGRAVLKLIEPTAGSVSFRGKILGELGSAELRAVRKGIQMIFQDPYASLNPRMTVRQIIAEPIRAFGLARGSEVHSRVSDLMETVGLSPGYGSRYPSEFSGGQRQRIGIARALAVDPEFIVADEPISALDVSIQAQIMNLLKQLQAEKGLTYLFISHDLRAVRFIADRVAVMYLGKIVELGPGSSVYNSPLMPYTRALISAVPLADPDAEAKRKGVVLKGDLPSSIDPPSGCAFRTRCPYAIDECARIVPQLREITTGHRAACIRINEQYPDIEENAAAGREAIGA